MLTSGVKSVIAQTLTEIGKSAVQDVPSGENFQTSSIKKMTCAIYDSMAKSGGLDASMWPLKMNQDLEGKPESIIVNDELEIRSHLATASMKKTTTRHNVRIPLSYLFQ